MTPSDDILGRPTSMARCPENAARPVFLFPNVPSVRSLMPSQRFLVYRNPVRPLPDILHDGDRLQRPAVKQAMTACVAGILPLGPPPGVLTSPRERLIDQYSDPMRPSLEPNTHQAREWRMQMPNRVRREQYLPR